MRASLLKRRAQTTGRCLLFFVAPNSRSLNPPNCAYVYAFLSSWQMPNNTPIPLTLLVPFEEKKQAAFFPGALHLTPDNKLNLFTLCLPIYAETLAKFPSELAGYGYALTIIVDDADPLYYQDDGITPVPSPSASPSVGQSTRTVVLSLYHPSYSCEGAKPVCSKHQTKLPQDVGLMSRRGLTMTMSKKDPAEYIKTVIRDYAAMRADAARIAASKENEANSA